MTTLKRILLAEDDPNDVELTLSALAEYHLVNEIVVARHAVYQGNVWQLMDVLTTHFTEGAIKTDHSDAMTWNSSLTPEVVGLVSIPPENLSIWDLSGYIGYLRENGLDSGPYELSLWIRIMTPLATAGMVLLSVPFVFGSMRSVACGATTRAPLTTTLPRQLTSSVMVAFS